MTSTLGNYVSAARSHPYLETETRSLSGGKLPLKMSIFEVVSWSCFYVAGRMERKDRDQILRSEPFLHCKKCSAFLKEFSIHNYGIDVEDQGWQGVQFIVDLIP